MPQLLVPAGGTLTCAHCQERQAIIYWGRFAVCGRCYDPLHLAAFDGLLTPESIYQLSVEREMIGRWNAALEQLDASRISWWTPSKERLVALEESSCPVTM